MKSINLDVLSFKEVHQLIHQLQARQIELERQNESLKAQAQDVLESLAKGINLRVLESMTEGVSVADQNGIIFFTNPALDAMFEYEQGELIGQHISFLTLNSPEESTRLFNEVIPKLETEGNWSGEVSNRKKDGLPFTTYIQISVLEVSGKAYWVSVQQDITERVQAQEVLQQRSRELALLNQTSRLFSATLDPDELLAIILDELRHLLGVTATSAWLVDPQTEELVCRQATGPYSEIVQRWRLSSGQGLAGWVVERGESLNVSDARGDERHYTEIDEQTGLTLCSILTVPLRSKQRVIGVLQLVDSEIGLFDNADLTLLEPLAASAAIAIENARLYQQAQYQIAERKRAEEALRNAHDELERRVAERTVELTGANAALRQEIAERKKTGKALRQSEQRYKQLLESVTDYVYIVTVEDGQPVATSHSPSCLAVTGYTSAEYEINPYLWYEMIYEADREVVMIQTAKVISGEETSPIEHRIIHKNGTRRWVRNTSVARKDKHGRIVAYDGLITDITERKRAEQEIYRRNQELELFNRLIAASAAGSEPEVILETACRELAITFNVPQATAALLNEEKTAAEVVAEYRIKDRPTVLHETISVANSPLLQYLLTHKGPLAVDDAQNDPRLTSIHNLMCQRGVVSLLIIPLIIGREVVGSLNLDAVKTRHFTAEEISLAWSVADQLSGALAQARLNKDRQLLGVAIEQTAEAVVITDTEGAILYVNSAFEQITGYKRAEVIGQNPRILRSGKHNDAFYQELWSTLKTGQVWQGRFVNKKKDGALYTIDTTITPVRDGSGAIVNYVDVHRDVTQQLLLEEQYRQAQKMEAIGRLTGGIAHDFNNLLTAINGYAELTQMRLPPDSPLQSLVDNILQSGQRAANLIRQLLAFSRKQVIELKILDLKDIVAELYKLLKRIISEDIELITTLAPDLWPVKADPAQIEQVIVNLAVNARDAMPDGGKLTIAADNVVLDEDDVAGRLELRPGEYILLSVSDTGVGMSEAVQTHIFEPFFTTKEQGKGTGLGLATVFGIVKQSGGDIRVCSEEGVGTTFKVFLPRVLEIATPLTQQEQRLNLPRGAETVLLVEDDPGVREMITKTLSHQGYTVLEVPDGQQALDLIQEYDEKIDLLLTDVVMPQMSGTSLADQLRFVRPETRVLFTSGYADKVVVHHDTLEEGIAFLQKPFSAVTLTCKVREVLDIPWPDRLA
jgi:PAS domain S-box-containing protein